MRFGELVSRVVAAGMFVGLGGQAAMAGASSDNPPVPLRDRVFFDRDALSPELRALLASGIDDPRIVPLPNGSPPYRTATDLLQAKSGRAAAIVVAALAPSKGGSLTDSRPNPLGEPRALAWVVPALPPLLSNPTAMRARQEGKIPVLEDPSLRAVEHALKARSAHRPEARPALGHKKHLSEPSQLAISKLPSPKQMSALWTDPLASLDFDEPSGQAAPEFIMPFANGRVTSLFNQGRRHPAIDLAGALGSPVLATTSRQTVVFAGGRGGYGNAVITRDANGRTHLYGHLQRVTSRVGQVLNQGDKLGHLGSTGYSTGPHVHYEVRDGKGQHINPVTLLFPDRRVGRGYAWLDVGQFAARAQVASRAATGDRLASATSVDAAPRRIRAKPKARAKAYRTAGYAHRWRRAVSDESD
jgi:murein DD-endopeptidase MepM/ murein hydrolase activator NlpD